MNKILVDITGKMIGIINDEQLESLTYVLASVLNEYEFKTKRNELVVYEDVNSQYIEGFLAWKLMEGKSQKTIKLYNYILRKAFESIQKSVLVINEYDIFLYLAHRQKTGASKAYAENIRRVLASFYGWMHKKNFVSVNPCAGIDAIKRPKKIKEEFSDEELELIRFFCEDEREKALIEFLYESGVRVSELSSLNREDINFKEGSCIVYGKGAKERVVFLSQKSLLALKIYLSIREDSNPALFVGERKPYNRLKPQAIRRILKKIEKRSKVPNIHPHRFRRTLATNLLKKGMPLEEVSALLGHANLDTTLIYCGSPTAKVKSTYTKLMSA